MPDISVRANDGHQFTAQFFDAADAKAPLFIVCPAMGVQGRYYKGFAEALNASGYQAVTFDLRGQGTSSLRASKKVNWGYQDLVSQDWPALLRAVRAQRPEAPVYFWGHSQGGHISSLFLAANPSAASGLILIASGLVYFRGWPFPQNLKLLAQTQIIRAAAVGLGYFPGEKMGFGGLQAKNEMVDWSNNALFGSFKLLNSSVDYEAKLKQVAVPVYAFSLEGDDYAPPGAVRGLAKKMPAARYIHLTTQDLPAPCLDHMRWARTPEPVISRVLRELAL